MRRVLRKTLLQGLRTAFVFIFVAGWVFSAWPQVFRFPPRVQEAKAAVNFVQSNVRNAGPSSIQNSVTSSVTNAGDLLVVAVAWDQQSATISSITDTQGNTYTSAIGPTDWNGTSERAQLFYAKNILGGANTVTVKLSAAANNYFEVNVIEYSGADTGSPLDATSVATGTGTSLDSGSHSTSSGNELIFGYGNSGTANIIEGAGFIGRTRLGGGSIAEDKYVTAPGSYNATATSGPTSNWIMMMATFKSKLGGYGASLRSDILSDDRPSVTSNHTFTFTANHAVMGSSTLTFALPEGFISQGGLDCGDIDAATSSQFNFNWPSCAPTATAWGAQVQAFISNVQYNAQNSPNATSTNGVDFTRNTFAGDLIVVAAYWDNNTRTISSVTDTQGNSYTSAIGPISLFSGGSRAQLFYAKNIKGGADKVTVTLTGNNTTNFEVYIHEYSGADTNSPLDATSVAVDDVGSTAMDSGSATTTAPNELIFGYGENGSAPAP
jgi:hypothetical protein